MEKAVRCRRNGWVWGQAWAPTHGQPRALGLLRPSPLWVELPSRHPCLAGLLSAAGIRKHQPEEFQKRGHSLCHATGFLEVIAPGWLIWWLPSPGGTHSTPVQPLLVGHAGCPGPALLSRHDGEWWNPVEKGPSHIASSNAFVNLLINLLSARATSSRSPGQFPHSGALTSLAKTTCPSSGQPWAGEEGSSFWGWDWELPGRGVGYSGCLDAPSHPSGLRPLGGPEVKWKLLSRVWLFATPL